MFYFDGGDCCLENVTKNEWVNDDFMVKPCLDCECMPSYGYAYCVQAEVGYGICQDYNNSPQCNYDQGDCCQKA